MVGPGDREEDGPGIGDGDFGTARAVGSAVKEGVTSGRTGDDGPGSRREDGPAAGPRDGSEEESRGVGVARACGAGVECRSTRRCTEASDP